MKLPRIAFVLITAATIAGALPAVAASSLLTPDGVRYALVADGDRTQVQIARAEGHQRATLVAPTTQDAETESQAQLAYDTTTATLYVIWVRENEGNAEIRFASLNADKEWSTPRMVAAGSGAYRNVQFVLTHAQDGDIATLLHVAWWSVNGSIREPEYALFAYENGRSVSAQVANLDDLSGLKKNVVTTSGMEYEPEAVHPPLAMARNGEGVDVAFGAVDSTVLTRLNITPRKVGGDVRIWKPLGRSASRTPRAGVFLTAGGAPVHGVIVNGRLALYSVSDDFRFIMLRNDGTWSEPHSVRVDADNTVDELVRDLRHTVQELMDHEADAAPAAAER